MAWLSSGWHPKENRYLGSPKLFTKQAWARWQQSYQGDNCDRAGLAELRQAVIRLRTAEAQATNPDDKKHLLLKTGEIKWCWKCGARVERDSAPRLLLKTACSGAPRTKEYERALSLLGKGQHPKGFRHPSLTKSGISGIRTTAACFSVCASCPVPEPPSCYSTRTHRVTCQRRRQKQKQTNEQTNK